MKNFVIRWASVLLLATLSGCLTGSGTNQTSSNFVISSNNAYNISDTTVTLSGGFMNPVGASASVTFELGETTDYLVTNPNTPITFSSAGYAPVKQEITGLTPNKTYHYRLRIVNGATTSYSADNTFTTLATSLPAALVSNAAPQQMAEWGNYVYSLESPSVANAGVGSLKVMDKTTQVVTTLVAPLNAPFGLVVDGAGNAYFTETTVAGVTGLYKQALGAPTAGVLGAPIVNGLNAPTALAIDNVNGNILISEAGTWNGVTGQKDGAILRVPTAVAMPALTTPKYATTVVNGAVATITLSGTGYTLGMVIAPAVGVECVITTVLPLTCQVTNGGAANLAVPLVGGVPATAFTTTPLGYAVATGLFRPESVVTDGVNVYWNEQNMSAGVSSVWSASATTAASATVPTGAIVGTRLVNNLSGSLLLAQSGTAATGNIYYSANNGTISRVAKAGGVDQVPTVVASGINGLRPITLDATGANVYWADASASAGSGVLRKVSVSGGVSTVVATGFSNPGAVVVDATNVYWAQQSAYDASGISLIGDGKILSHAK